MQGRSLKNGEITQEISDLSRTYRLLGSDKYVFRFIFSSHYFVLTSHSKIEFSHGSFYHKKLRLKMCENEWKVEKMKFFNLENASFWSSLNVNFKCCFFQKGCGIRESCSTSWIADTGWRPWSSYSSRSRGQLLD